MSTPEIHTEPWIYWLEAFAVDGFDGAVGDVVPLPKMGRPRARAIFRRMTSVLNLDAAVNPQRERRT
jgi:hypothetical protein